LLETVFINTVTSFCEIIKRLGKRTPKDDGLETKGESIFFFWGGGGIKIKKNFTKRIKICLYVFLLHVYESEKKIQERFKPSTLPTLDTTLLGKDPYRNKS
jgi:hypothetical protein